MALGAEPRPPDPLTDEMFGRCPREPLEDDKAVNRSYPRGLGQGASEANFRNDGAEQRSMVKNIEEEKGNWPSRVQTSMDEKAGGRTNIVAC